MQGMDYTADAGIKIESSFLSADVERNVVDNKRGLLPCKEYIDISEFAEQHFISRTNENKTETNPALLYFDQTSDSSCYYDNYILPENVSPYKKLKNGDSNVDWIDNVIFDNTVIPQESDIVALTSFESPNVPKYDSRNVSFIQNYCPDLSDILDESCPFWETYYENTPIGDIEEEIDLVITNDVRSCYAADNSNMRMIENYSSYQPERKTPLRNADFPCQVSVFNIMETVDNPEEKDIKSLSSVVDTSCISQSHWGSNDERDEHGSWNNFEGTFITNGDCDSILYPAIEMTEKTLGESLDDCNIAESALFTNNDTIHVSDVGMLTHVSNENYLINPDPFKTNLILNSDDQIKLKPSHQLLINKSENNDMNKQNSTSIISNNKLINVDCPEFLNFPVTSNSVLSKQAISESLYATTTVCDNPQPTSFIVFTNDGDIQNTQEDTNYQLSAKKQKTVSAKPVLKPKISSAPILPSNQQLLLLSTGEGQQFLLVCNNQQPQLQKTQINQTPTIVTLNEKNSPTLSKKSNSELFPTTLTTNSQFPMKNKTHFQIADKKNKVSDTSKLLAIDGSRTERLVDLMTQNISVNHSYVRLNQQATSTTSVNITSSSVINAQKTCLNAGKAFTPISVVPISPLTRSTTSTSSTSTQSQIIFLDKLGVLSSKKNLTPKSKTLKFQNSTVKKSSGKIGQRRKTVRELLQEKRKQNALDSLVQSYMKDKASKMSVMRPMTMVTKNPSTSTKTITSVSNKPSILMLNSDINKPSGSGTSALNPPKSNLILPSSTTIVENTEGNSYLNTVEGDVDDPEAHINLISDKETLPSFERRRVDARTFRPKHFDMQSLEIGDFKVNSEDQKGNNNLCKFKIIFAKQHFTYEFPLSSDDNPNNIKRMACIIVPFDSLIAINCLEKEIRIKVTSQPQTFLGSGQQRVGVICSLNVYNTSKLVDVTSGATEKCSIHKVFLRQPYANRIKMLLWEFDTRFKMLTSLCIKEGNDFSTPAVPTLDPTYIDDSDGCLSVKRSKKDQKLAVRQLPQPDLDDGESLLKLQVCSCRISCRSLRCSCVKAAQKCNTGRSLCICSNCDNPLNVLDTIGVDPELAILDSCLFQNIYQIDHLRRYLCQEMKLPCCTNIATVQECIPGTVLCPNTDCMESVQYSWCRAMLCVAERNPRNHCGICGKCSFSIGYHCENCNVCYIKRPQTPWCLKCTADPTAIQEV